jgi:hypothetical protein
LKKYERKGTGGMIPAAASSNQTVKRPDGDEGKPRVGLEKYTGDLYGICVASKWKDPGHRL